MRQRNNIPLAISLGLLSITLLTAEEAIDPQSLAQEIEALTQAPTRIVWARHLSAKGNDTHLVGKNQHLMGFDTTQPERGVHPILAQKGNYSRPLITPDGKSIIYSRKEIDSSIVTIEGQKRHPMTSEIFIVSWDGAHQRSLGEGYACDVVRDAEGRDWVYVGRDLSRATVVAAREVVRFPLSDPSKIETVWSGRLATMTNFQVSRDGTRAAALFPWPNAGLAKLNHNTWKKYDNGCWPSLAPDNSYLFWVFDGTHRYLHFHHGERHWKARINTAPGIDGYEVYHPRWSNHTQFFSMTGPFTQGRGGNRIGGGGPQVEIYLGKFSSRYDTVEKWIRLTDNDQPDFYPDLWIQGGEKTVIDTTAIGPADQKIAPPPKLAATWPGSTEGLLFLWENQNATNEIATAESIWRSPLHAKGTARYGPYHNLEPSGGYFQTSPEVDQRLATAVPSNDAFSLELTFSTPSEPSAQWASLIAQSLPHGEANFALLQKESDLYAFIRTTKSGLYPLPDKLLKLATLESGRTHHLLLSYRPDMFIALLDGEPLEVKLRGTLGNWVPQKLIIGNTWSGNQPWMGSLEGIALSARAIALEEGQKRHELNRARIGQRGPREPILVEATLLSAQEAPRVADIGQYTRALAISTYRVDKVLRGQLEDSTLEVYHWAIMDRQPLPDYPRTVGERYTLQLEPFESHPQLQSESRGEPEDFDAALYYDITPPVTLTSDLSKSKP